MKKPNDPKPPVAPLTSAAESFMKNINDPKPQIYIGHVPKDSKLASDLAEELKRKGAEVTGRTVQKRERALNKYEARELEEAAHRYLKKLKGPEPMQMELRVFLSYATEDYDDVFRFHLELLRMGMSTWLDQSEIMGIRLGENWIERTFEMLSTCCSLAYFMSPHSIQSTVVGYEVGFFIERMKIRSGTFFAIVLLHKMDVEYFKQLSVPIIEFYRLTAKDAAEQFVHEMVAFYQRSRTPPDAVEGQSDGQMASDDSNSQ